MKRWLKSSHFAKGGNLLCGGYTITETLIVLAVTTVMLSAIMLAFSGRQAKVEFTQSVRDYEAMLQNIISDVNKGYYQAPDDRECVITQVGGVDRPNLVPVAPGSVNTGTSRNCVFVGKYLTISPDGLSTNVGSIIGKRVGLDQSEELAQGSLSGFSGLPHYEPNDTRTHSFKLRVQKIVTINENPPGVFAQVQRLDVYSSNTFPSSVNTNSSALFNGAADPNSVFGIMSGFVFCLEGQNGQKADITVSRDNGDDSLFTKLDTNPQSGVDPCG